VALNLHSYGESINKPPGALDAILPAAVEANVDSLAASIARSGGSINKSGTEGWAWGTAHEAVGYYVGGEASDQMLYQHGILAYSPEVGPIASDDPRAFNGCPDLPAAAQGGAQSRSNGVHCFIPDGRTA